MAKWAYVGVGSNLDADDNVRAAIHELARQARLARVSTFYRTAPIGRPDDPWFINGVVAVETDAPALALERNLLKSIEAELGRHRGPDPNAPRTIDLDLLLFEGDPAADPHIRERAFLARPLAEIAPWLEVGGRSIRSIAEELPQAGMVPLPALTRALKREVRHG